MDNAEIVRTGSLASGIFLLAFAIDGIRFIIMRGDWVFMGLPFAYYERAWHIVNYNIYAFMGDVLLCILVAIWIRRRTEKGEVLGSNTGVSSKRSLFAVFGGLLLNLLFNVEIIMEQVFGFILFPLDYEFLFGWFTWGVFLYLLSLGFIKESKTQA